MEYVSNPKEKKCIFCEKHGSDNDRDNLILFRAKYSFILLNLYPYNNGHLLIAPYEHIGTSYDLSANVNNEMTHLASKSMKIIKSVLSAEGFNFGANIGTTGGAGIKDHVHFHVVPRWVGDTNFMPIVGHTKVVMDGLLETFDSLMPHFCKIKISGE